MSFGQEQTFKEHEDEDLLLDEDLFAALNNPMNRTLKKANVLDTVARNAIEH